MNIKRLALPLALVLGTTGSFASDKNLSDALNTAAKSEVARTVQALGASGDSVILIQQLKMMTNLYGEQLKTNEELRKQSVQAEQRNDLLKHIVMVLKNQE